MFEPNRIWARLDRSTIYADGSSPIAARTRKFSGASEYALVPIQPAAVGWQLVPVEPTGIEIEAGCRMMHELQGTQDADAPLHSPYQNSCDTPDRVRWQQWDEIVRAVRASMLSAAPKPGGE